MSPLLLLQVSYFVDSEELSTLGAREPLPGYRQKMVLCSPLSTRYVTMYIVTPFRSVRRHFETLA